jgi:periodic tryptophan protein 2
LLVVGFASGIFCIYEMPDFNMIHSLSISQSKITTVSINSSGEWLAFGSRLGQLLVWEWQSETCKFRLVIFFFSSIFFSWELDILKQQGHSLEMNALAYSPDGLLIATGKQKTKLNKIKKKNKKN